MAPTPALRRTGGLPVGYVLAIGCDCRVPTAAGLVHADQRRPAETGLAAALSRAPVRWQAGADRLLDGMAGCFGRVETWRRARGFLLELSRRDGKPPSSGQLPPPRALAGVRAVARVSRSPSSRIASRRPSGASTSNSHGIRAACATNGANSPAPNRSTHDVASTASKTPSPGGNAWATTSALAWTSTRASISHGTMPVPSATSATGSGGSSKRYRCPVSVGAAMRSIRNVRHASRSRSRATRYHLLPVWTMWNGSTDRSLSWPA